MTSWETVGRLLADAGSDDEKELAAERFAAFAAPELLRFFVWKGASAALGEDLAVDVIRKAVLKVHQFASRPVNFKNWVLKIATNCLLEHFRNHQPQVSLSDCELPAADLTPDAPVLGGVAAAVQEVVGQLSSDEQRLLELRLGRSGMTFCEIGQEFGVPDVTARSRYHRLLNKVEMRLSQNREIADWLETLDSGRSGEPSDD